MLPIVTVWPAVTGVLTFIAVTELVAPSGTTKVPEPVLAQATVADAPFFTTVHVLTAAVAHVTEPPTIQP
jgi:nitrate reductase gamma subunit